MMGRMKNKLRGVFQASQKTQRYFVIYVGFI